VAATAGVAAADPVSPLDPNVAVSVDGGAGILGTAAVDPFSAPDPLDLAISFDGMTLIQEGTATASAGAGDLAIAVGAGSDADADNGPFDSAIVFGANSDAIASGFFSSATVFGTNAAANADGSIGDLASVVNTGSAFDEAVAGGSITGLVPLASGQFDIATVFGTGSTAIAGSSENTIGSFDLAAVFGDMLNAVATGGSHLVDILP
jgi:hypothetical protein